MLVIADDVIAPVDDNAQKGHSIEPEEQAIETLTVQGGATSL